jgi:hypothetical protein
VETVVDPQTEDNPQAEDGQTEEDNPPAEDGKIMCMRLIIKKKKMHM